MSAALSPNVTGGSGIGGQSPYSAHRSAFGGVGEGKAGSAISTADELEEEVRRAREERQRRRNQLSGGGGSGGGSISPSPILNAQSPRPQVSDNTITSPQLSGEETLRKLLGERGITSTTLEKSLAPPTQSSFPATMSISNSPPKSSYSQTQKSNALLDRYGGAHGPTGTANPGRQGQSVSLASFMGGKASGPRLGKLAGDGRSAPAEAAMIDSSRHALPGLASGRPPPSASTMGASPLATFLEARAANKGGIVPAKNEARSPSPTRSSAFELQSGNSAWKQELKAAEKEVNSERRPASPVRISNNSQTKNEKETFDSVSHLHDASTSPFKASDLSHGKILDAKPNTASSQAHSSAGIGLSPGSIVHSPTVDALSRFPQNTVQHSPAVSPTIPQEPNMSPAFMATQNMSERQPTESLTRLRSKKMVEQRVKEARERDSTPQQETANFSSSGVRSPLRSPNVDDEQAKDSKSPWSSSTNQRSDSPQHARSLPNHDRMSNALPGLGGFLGAGGNGPPRNLYAVNRKSPEEEAAAFAQPVRLPGMGGASSPFAARKMVAEEADNGEEQSKPLQSLISGRARPKKAFSASTATRSNAPVPQYATSSIVSSGEVAPERIDKAAFDGARQAFEAKKQHTPSPVKEVEQKAKQDNLQLRTSGMQQQKPQNQRQDSNTAPDSAAKIADSTAALEALLEGRKVKTPPPSQNTRANIPRTSGTLKIAQNERKLGNVDHSVLLQFSSSSIRNSAMNHKLVSLEVFSIDSNGSSTTLQGREASTLYEKETQVIVYRYKESSMSAVISTNVYARVGRLSPIVTGARGAEARKVMEIAQQHRVPVIDARQGRETVELARILGGHLITKEGSRRSSRSYDESSSTTYHVRGVKGALFIDQVDSLTANLSSSLSVVVQLIEDAFVWHGRGSSSAIREGAMYYANVLSPQHKRITQYEEGSEDELFWTCFDRETAYSDAWHHRFLKQLPDDQLTPRLYSLQVQGSSAKIVEQTPFSALDIRRDGVHLLQLPMEQYILVGPDARSNRQVINAMIEAATTLSRHLTKVRGPTIMTTPIHVLILPSLVPREVRSAFRYWHDEHLNGERWQRMQLRMNIWEKREALKQMEQKEIDFALLEDDLFLPVGVGLDDIRGIDI